MNNINKFNYFKKFCIKRNLIGFLISIILLYISFVVATKSLMSHSTTIFVIIINTMIQVIIHFKYFLHISNLKDYKWNVGIFIFSVTVILIIVVGSLWIMNDLNHMVTIY